MADKTLQQVVPIRNNILRWPSVHERVSICRSHAHYLIQKGLFPKPIKLGGGKNARASGWIESEIDQWIEDRIHESRNNDSVA